MGAATFTVGANSAGQSPHGVTPDGKRFVEGTFTGSASYATGGDSITLPGDLTSVDSIEVVGTNTAGYTVELAGTATVPLIKCYDASATQTAAAQNLSARASFRLRLVGH